MSLNNFQLLLNDLSNEFDQRNLQSLIHICGELIPGGQRENIKTGWEVFNILRHQNALGEGPQKMKFLLRIMRELRPKRRDLVLNVKQYIEENCDQPEMILDSDCHSISELKIPSRPYSTPKFIADGHTGCIVRFGCFDFSCIPCCEGCHCCVFLGITFALLAVLAALAWYTRVFPQAVQHYITAHDLTRSGPLIISVLGFIAACCATCGGCLYAQQRRKETSARQTGFVLSDSFHSGMSDRPISACERDQQTPFTIPRASLSTIPNGYSQGSGLITASSSMASNLSARAKRGSADHVTAYDFGGSQNDHEELEDLI